MGSHTGTTAHMHGTGHTGLGTYKWDWAHTQDWAHGTGHTRMGLGTHTQDWVLLLFLFSKLTHQANIFAFVDVP